MQYPPIVLPLPVRRIPAPPKPAISRLEIVEPFAEIVSPSAAPAAVPSIRARPTTRLPLSPTSSEMGGRPPAPIEMVPLPPIPTIIPSRPGFALAKVMASRSVQVPVPVRAQSPGPEWSVSPESLTTMVAP